MSSGNRATEKPLPQSSAGGWSSEAARDVSTSAEPWRVEVRILNVNVHNDNIELYAEAEKMGKIRNFRTYIEPNIDLEFNWDTAETYRPEWRSLSKTVFGFGHF